MAAILNLKMADLYRDRKINLLQKVPYFRHSAIQGCHCAGRARPALTKSDQQGRGKNEKRPAKKKGFFFNLKVVDFF